MVIARHKVMLFDPFHREPLFFDSSDTKYNQVNFFVSNLNNRRLWFR